MANSYSSTTFFIDTSTNVAGLTALKGSPCGANDRICVAPARNDNPTLTIDADLACNEINVGFAAVAGGSQTTYGGTVVINDDVDITITDGRQINVSLDSALICNGTMRSLGTGNGNADQTFALFSADNDAVMVDGEWWGWVPSLTGLRLDVTATTNTTSITCTTDPRTVGVAVGMTIEIRTRADGTLKAAKVVSAVSATSVSWASGAVSVTANEGVYIAIAATDKVYTSDGTNAIFGDGTASAWNNNGGAKPANNATITSPGITLRSSGTTGVYWNNVRGNIHMHGVCMSRQRPSSQWWGSHVYLAPAPTWEDCAFVRSANIGIYVAIGCTDVTIDGVAYANASYGISVANGCTDVTIDGVAYANASYGIYVNNGCTDVTIDGVAYANASYGIYVNNGCTDVTIDGVAYANANIGISVDRGNHNVRVRGRLYSNTSGQYQISQEHGVAYGLYRTAATGDAGLLKWYASDARPSLDLAKFVPRSTQLGFRTQNDYYTTDVMHTPGLTAWGAATATWTLNSGTVANEYRVSHDYGNTWTAWATLPATITDTPDINGECIQFRAKRTDANLALYEPRLSDISVVCTFDANWTLPASWTGIHDVCAAMKCRVKTEGVTTW